MKDRKNGGKVVEKENRKRRREWNDEEVEEEKKRPRWKKEKDAGWTEDGEEDERDIEGLGGRRKVGRERERRRNWSGREGGEEAGERKQRRRRRRGRGGEDEEVTETETLQEGSRAEAASCYLSHELRVLLILSPCFVLVCSSPRKLYRSSLSTFQTNYASFLYRSVGYKVY